MILYNISSNKFGLGNLFRYYLSDSCVSTYKWGSNDETLDFYLGNEYFIYRIYNPEVHPPT